MRHVPTSPRRGRAGSGSWLAQPRGRLLADAAAAVTLAALAVASAALEPTETVTGVTRPFGGTAAVLVAAMTLPLATRRHRPRTIAVLTTAIAAVAVTAGYPVGIGPFGAVFALHSLAYTTSNPTTLRVGGPCGLALLASLIWSPGALNLPSVAGNGLFIGFALAAGALLRIRNDQRDALVRQNAELTSAREAQVRSAVNEERLRIAREVHDAVSHALVAITLQARAGKRRLDRRPERTRDALDEVESLAQHALEETRSAVVSIRGDGQPALPPPRLTTASLHGLIGSIGGADLDIRLDLDLGDHHLDDEQERAAFRIVQESLSNVAKHAGAATAVVAITCDGEHLNVEVTNTGSRPAAPADGSGIRGMRERAERLGGTVAAGPTATGWRVHARLPARYDAPSVLA